MELDTPSAVRGRSPARSCRADALVRLPLTFLLNFTAADDTRRAQYSAIHSHNLLPSPAKLDLLRKSVRSVIAYRQRPRKRSLRQRSKCKPR